jgi:hypothetical protein
MPTATPTTAQIFYIGNMANASDYADAGTIDDVRVYNRALSAAEVVQLEAEAGVGSGKYQQAFVGRQGPPLQVE